MKYIAQFISFACIAAITVLISPAASAAGKKKASPTPTPSASPAAKASPSPTPSPSASPAAKVRAYPFHGMISAVDTKAKTFTIAGKDKSRVFKITDKTVISKAGFATSMKDVKEKEEVRGSYWKNADGSLEARSVKLGPLTPEEKAAEDARRERRAKKKAEKKAAAAAASSSASPAASASPAPSASPAASAKP